MMPLHPAGRPLHAYLAEDTEKALLMDKLGFDELFIGEHFSAATEPYPSPLMFAASLLPRTERLTFATGFINRRSGIRPWWRRKPPNSIT
jgi:alkanesulfonate monooxygenase SsuD/methylene tetrahydromethanopterin reductase-like flavin-dependent oxidoreductase (luciferase family)